MAARSSICAMLFAIPVFVTLLIGFSSGLSGLPFGINSLARGPGQESVTVSGQGAQNAAAARLAATASTAAATTPAPTGSAAGGAAGGGAVGGGTTGAGTGTGTTGTPTGSGASTPTATSSPSPTPTISIAPGGGSSSGGGNAGAEGGVQLPGGTGDIVDDAASGAGQAVGGLLNGN
jgi:hypothetical protein